MKDFFKDRYNILMILFLLLGCLIVSRLFDIQIIHGAEYFSNSQKRLLKTKEIPATRGRIFDSNGIPIAVNRQGYNCSILSSGLKQAELNSVVFQLAQILEKNGERYASTLSKYLAMNPFSFAGLSIQDTLNWQKDKNTFSIAAKDVIYDPGQFFTFLREKKFNIDKSYSDEDAYKIMRIRYEILKNQWYFDSGTPILIADDISDKSVAEIEERHSDLKGVITSVVPYRKYIDASLVSHVLGYVGPIKQEQLTSLQSAGYNMNDIIGQSGVEQAAEMYLKGTPGERHVEVDTEGRETAQISEIPSKPGDDVILTIDLNLQKVALDSLQRNIEKISTMGGKNNLGDANAGAVVALDVKTGAVLAMVSYPYYDPALFVADKNDKAVQQKISDLLNDTKASPMFNRAIQGKYAPGSTFKPIVAIAGLQEGVISPNDIIRDNGYVNIGGKDFYCLEYNRVTKTGAHGNLTIERALATSCNVFFEILGYRTTIDSLDKWADLFGLGRKTGIDIPNESAGVLASKANKKKIHNDDWRPADTAQTSIGQFDNAFTPLQLACYVSTLANGGKRFVPYIIKRIIDRNGNIIQEAPGTFQQIPLTASTINTVKKGMIAVTNSEDGTAVNMFRDLPFKVAGKTGTAETGFEANQSSNALFVCYAPADDPQIAVAVVVEKGVWGAYTAPIARDVLTAYFNQQKTDESILPATGAEVFTK